ncbi:MAG: LysR substrate-binding domain-containing protein [Limisphaerales bacterium]
MELRQLRYFVGVAEHLSFTKAAQWLRVAQPALSRQIRQLEEELGVRLLDRDRRGARLTKAGEAFLAEARMVLTQSEQAIRSAQETEKRERGQLNVGYVWGLFHSLVPTTVARFRQRFPDAGVHLFDLTATQQAEALAKGKLDAGFIGFADEAEAAGLKKRQVGSCAFVAVLPDGHRMARHSPVPLAKLAPDFFIVISEENYPSAARFVLEACAHAGFRPKILQAAERGHTILSLVAGGCGVALLPESLRALPHAGVVFRPLEQPPIGDLFIAWSAAHTSPMRDAFLALAGAQERLPLPAVRRTIPQ